MMAESISNSLTDTGSVVMAVDYSDNSEWAFDCKYMYIQDCFSEKKVCLIHHVLKKKHQLPPDVYVILVDNLRIFIFRISFLNLFFIL